MNSVSIRERKRGRGKRGERRQERREDKRGERGEGRHEREDRRGKDSKWQTHLDSYSGVGVTSWENMNELFHSVFRRRK